jgi:ion channel-forming bestrophin family protein
MIVCFVLLLLVINPLDAKETAGCIIAASKPKPRILNVNLKSGRRPDVSAGYRYRSDDWLGNFISIPRSFVLKRVVFHLSSNVVVCSTVILLHQRGLIGTLAPLAHTLLGGFLGLLLIFRTNSAYARFWEARSLWGKVTTTSRKLALEVAAYLHPVSPPVADRLVRLLAAFPTALAQQCLGDRRDSDSSPEAAQNEAEMNELVGASPLSPPMELCLQMHRLLARDHLVAPRGSPAHGSMTFALRCARLAELIDELNDALGGCQRIVRTPVPLACQRAAVRADALSL